MGTEYPSVTLVIRGDNARHFSIERVFADIAHKLVDSHRVRTVSLPHSGVRPDHLLRNLWTATKIRDDVVHVTGDVHYVLLALQRHSCCVVTVHDLNRFAELTGLRRWLYRVLWIWPLYQADAITCVSEFSREQLLSAAPKLAGRVRVVDNPLSEIFKPTYGVEPIPQQILAIGTAPNKNLEATIRACAAIDGVKLTVIGAMTPDQIELADRLDLDVTQRAGISDQELASEYQSASAVSFPSTAEGFGLPVIEAQGCGVPVVTSDIEPMNKISNGAALLVDPKDQDALTRALRRAIAGGPDIEEMIAAGRSNAERFSAASIAAQYDDIYGGLVNAEAASNA